MMMMIACSRRRRRRQVAFPFLLGLNFGKTTRLACLVVVAAAVVFVVWIGIDGIVVAGIVAAAATSLFGGRGIRTALLKEFPDIQVLGGRGGGVVRHAVHLLVCVCVCLFPFCVLRVVMCVVCVLLLQEVGLGRMMMEWVETHSRESKQFWIYESSRRYCCRCCFCCCYYSSL
jgi:hypothetical protein